MKNYLSLVSISAKVRRRQSRMTIVCIIVSVLLVTAIFSICDMSIRNESTQMQEKHGSWHLQLDNLSPDAAEKIRQRPDVAETGWAELFNFDADQPYQIGEKTASLCGTDESYMTNLTSSLEEGKFPQSDDEVMLSSNAKLALHVALGDRVSLHTPAGDFTFTVSGFGSDSKDDYSGQMYLVGAYMRRDVFHQIMNANMVSEHPSYYVKFQSAADASKAIPEFQEQYGLSKEEISENTAVMGLAGKSSNASMKRIYAIAAALFVMVLLAGVLMISGSMNSSVGQRIRFFGMMRCIGASRKQVIRFVRLEALNWCKTAVPVGLVLGTLASCGICAFLRYKIGGEWAGMPVFALSPVGLASGVFVGIVTVLLAARAPARRAAKVSPIAAVSGNAQSVSTARRPLRLRFGKVEQSLGIHHAMASKKNWFLMTASFSLSIILFLCFTVGLSFVHGLLPSLRSWQPDIVLNGYANALVLDQDLCDSISAIPGVDHVFGCGYLTDVPASCLQRDIESVNLMSYSDYLLDCTGENMMQGDIADVYGASGKAMTIQNKDNPLQVGDVIEINGKEVEITCSTSENLYPTAYSVICSVETFQDLTGEENASLVGIQLGKDADDETIAQISGLAASDVIFSDMRQENLENTNTYLAVSFILYSFLAILAAITLFNMINSISMSVTARFKQYGAMRAVGMDGRQLTRMIVAEAFTYAFSGLLVGCAIGITVSRLLHIKLVTRYFGIPWDFPVVLIAIILVFAVAAAMIAAYMPAKRMRNMEITDTINEL